MITNEQENKVERGGEFVESQFTLTASAKAFKVLIGNLYSDKVKAVLTELGQNASDSHVASERTNVPFEVTLPDFYNPNLIIRDFGTGMSHEFMMTKYSAAFYSSKDKSNDYAGAIGIGRLSLLSLCESYVATSFQNGEKRTYSVYINETGIPSIAYLGVEKTDEPDGFQVDAAVSPDSCNEFDEKAKQVYRFYKVKPTIKNRADFQMYEDKYIVQSDDKSWGLVGNGNQPYALMAMYCYPININAVTGLEDNEKNLLLCGAIIKFELGELNVTANREALFYDAKTIQSIKNKLALIKPHIEPIVLKQFQNKNIFEKMQLANSLLDYNGALHSISPVVRDVILGLKIPGQLDCSDFETTYFNQETRWNYNSPKFKKHEIQVLSYLPNAVYFYADKKSHLVLKAKKFLSEAVNANKKIVFFYAKDDNSIENFKQKYGFDVSGLPLASVLPFDPIVKIGTGATKRKALVFRGGYRQQDNWTEGELDETGEVIYVIRTSYAVDRGMPDACYSQKRLGDFIERLETLTGNKIQVFGLVESHLKNKTNKWKLFRDYYNEEVEKWQKTQEEEIATHNYYLENYISFPSDVLERIELDNQSLAHKVLVEFNKVNEVYNKLCHSAFSPSFHGKAVSKNYKYSYQTLVQHYPLLAHIKGDIDGKATLELAEYVKAKNLVDI